MQSLYESALSELDKVSSESQLMKILARYSDIITLTSDNEIVPIVDFGQYRSIVDRQGCFYVTNTLHKVKQDYICIAKSSDIPQIDDNMSSTEDISDKFLVLKVIRNELTKDCGTSLSATVTEGNRRAKIYMSTYLSCVYDGYYYYCQDYVDWTIKGFKKVLGIWYSYNSIYTYQNVEFTVHAMIHLYGKSGIWPDYYDQSASYPGPVTSPYEAWGYTWTEPIGETFISNIENYPSYLSTPYFTQVAGEGKSRGTEGWAVINCGY